MTPDKLRARVVTLVVAAIIGLAFGLYLLVALLLWRDPEAVLPGELWLAAGVFGGALVGFLSNSKGGQEGGESGPVEVRAPQGEPLEVREAAVSLRDAGVASSGALALCLVALVLVVVLAIVARAVTA